MNENEKITLSKTEKQVLKWAIYFIILILLSCLLALKGGRLGGSTGGILFFLAGFYLALGIIGSSSIRKRNKKASDALGAATLFKSWWKS